MKIKIFTLLSIAFLFSLFCFVNVYVSHLTDDLNRELLSKYDYVSQDIDELLYLTQKQNRDIEELKNQLEITKDFLNHENRNKLKISLIKRAINRTVIDNDYVYQPSYIVLEQYAKSVVKWSDEYDVPVSLVLSITRQESGFNPDAVSRVGAVGLMQLMPETAKEVASELNVKSFDLRNIDDNVRFGIFYFMRLYNLFGGNTDLALKAYNCGPVCVAKVLNNKRKTYPLETRKYSRNILSSCLVEEDLECIVTGYVQYYKRLGL